MLEHTLFVPQVMKHLYDICNNRIFCIITHREKELYNLQKDWLQPVSAFYYQEPLIIV